MHIFIDTHLHITNFSSIFVIFPQWVGCKWTGLSGFGLSTFEHFFFLFCSWSKSEMLHLAVINLFLTFWISYIATASNFVNQYWSKSKGATTSIGNVSENFQIWQIWQISWNRTDSWTVVLVVFNMFTLNNHMFTYIHIYS